MKILIVKLGAMGDVLRTTPLLTAFKRKYPRSSITWLTDRASAPVLAGNGLIDRLLHFSPEALRLVGSETFDLALNLDKDGEALDAIAAADAREKKGFGWNASRSGVAALNADSAYAVRLGLDDELKFRINQKTYQEISFEQAGLAYAGEEYILGISQEDMSYAREHLKRIGMTPGEAKRAVGLNTGSGDRFAGKRLPPERLIELCRMLALQTGSRTVLLGGPSEEERNVTLERASAPHAVNAGTHHTITQFAALVSHLGLVITGDTIAMHVAIAAKVPAVVFFGSTCASEIELYGRGAKIVSEIECAPCYKRDCPINEKCMSDLPLEEMVRKVHELLGVPAERPR